MADPTPPEWMKYCLLLVLIISIIVLILLLVYIPLSCGQMVNTTGGIYVGDLENAFYDLSLAIISALIVVPIVFMINDYLLFNEYLRLLTQEIKNDLELVDQLPQWLTKVRNKERPWLPGINSNQPQPGYVLKYLSMNIYYNFLSQRYWLYLNRGTADKLSELYEFIRRYCDIVQSLQTEDKSMPPYMNIIRDKNEHVLDINVYSEGRFYFTLVEIPPGIHTNLKITTDMIKHHSSALNLNDIGSFKDPHWWYPKWLKNLLIY